MSTNSLHAALQFLRQTDPQLAYDAVRELDALVSALKPFAEFAKAFNANPMLGGDDALYSIHGGPGAPSCKGAELRLSDCRAALKAME
jgi:hypothetical protein